MSRDVTLLSRIFVGPWKTTQSADFSGVAENDSKCGFLWDRIKQLKVRIFVGPYKTTQSAGFCGTVYWPSSSYLATASMAIDHNTSTQDSFTTCFIRTIGYILWCFGKLKKTYLSDVQPAEVNRLIWSLTPSPTRYVYPPPIFVTPHPNKNLYKS